MEFDPVGSAQSIPHMIQNDTLIEVLDQDQLSECLKHITLNVDDSLYILNQVQSKYKVPDRFKAVRHIFTDFGEGDSFDSKKFVEFIKSLGRCLHLEVLDSIAAIVESAFSKIDQLSFEIKQNSQKTAKKPDACAQTQQTPQTQNQAVNKNIEELKKIPKTEENFDKIYEICQRVATENDKDAMSFAVREKFVYVTEKGGDGDNVFIKAAGSVNYKLNLVRLLIESGIDINCRNKYNYTALIKASKYSCYEVVKLLLTVPGIDVNAKNNGNWTALIWASEKGHHEVVKLLLTVPGIDVNARDDDNWTALIWASLQGRHEVVKLLLTVPGIDVNAKNKCNSTALIYASIHGYHEIVKLLLTVPGIDVNVKTLTYMTALNRAKTDEIKKMLRAYGATY